MLYFMLMCIFIKSVCPCVFVCVCVFFLKGGLSIYGGGGGILVVVVVGGGGGW